MPVKRSGVYAVEQICRMRGRSQSQLLRCSDGNYYVVKFQNNPQGARILANELLATILAEQMGLPVPDAAIVEVSEDLISHSGDLVIKREHKRIPCQAGLCFGSRYPCHIGLRQEFPVLAAYDFLPNELLSDLANIADFVGMLVFDKWTGNADDRQIVFSREGSNLRYRALMIDNGSCFNGAKWNFLDAPRHGLCCVHGAYDTICGMETFDEWVTRLERRIDENVLMVAFQAIPPEWYECDKNSLFRLLEELDQRRKGVRDLFRKTIKYYPAFFRNWTCGKSQTRARAASAALNTHPFRNVSAESN